MVDFIRFVLGARARARRKDDRGERRLWPILWRVALLVLSLSRRSAQMRMVVA